ncbi:MAG TPA: hypothetical protein VHV81_12440 [Steroidobacteraceae bacterium]|jgi:hypothetical protein|nr:hypothetical protein [Steroidobacteraceae bacterium]
MTETAGSGDLGFAIASRSAAPGGKTSLGHALEIVRRDAGGQWRIALRREIAHAGPAGDAVATAADIAAAAKRENPGPPPARVLEGDPIESASREFQDAARDAGVDGALRAYGRNAGFILLVEGEAPMGLGAADRYWKRRAAPGAWTEREHGRSADATLGYRAGEVAAGGPRAYVQIWQFDPKVANWGLRVLLISSAVSK